MKIKYLALVALCGCALQATPAAAQTLRQPASVRPAAMANDNANFSYGYYDGQEEPSPSDAAAQQAAPEPAAQEPVVQTANPCDSCFVGRPCGGCESCYLFGSSEPFKLFNRENRWGLNVGFWSQVGYHTEGANGFGDRLMNSYPNHVQLQQQWFFVEKAVNTGGCGWDWGFRADYVYGTDAPDTQAFGDRPNAWDNPWDYGSAYGSAIPQLYAEVGYNNLKAKFGHFFSPMGYEVVAATGNFFYSHSFEHYLIEPFTHTGALLEQKVNDDVTVLGGWTAGWDTGFDRNGGSNFLGGVKLQLTENASFSYITSWGDVGYDTRLGAGSDQNGYAHTLLFTWNLSDHWTYVCQSDMVDNDLYFWRTQDALSLNNYLFYKFNDCWAVGTRLEWLKDPALNGRFGLDPTDEVVDLTVGLNYRPAANVVVRPELRWDDYERGSLLQDTFLFGIDTVITY
jgi:hypothetical protein